MGRFIFSDDIIDVTPSMVTVNQIDSDYPVEGMLDIWELYRHSRSANDNTWNIDIDFGATTSLQALFLDDLNINKIRLFEDNGDGNWSQIADYDITEDRRCFRYKAYIPLTFNNRRLRISFDSAVGTKTDDLSQWRIGRFVCFGTVKELARNVSWGYTVTTSRPVKPIGRQAISLGDKIETKFDLIFKERLKDHEDDLFFVGSLQSAAPVLLYENSDNPNKAYLCIKDGAGTQVTYINCTQVTGGTVTLRELVRV